MRRGPCTNISLTAAFRSNLSVHHDSSLHPPPPCFLRRCPHASSPPRLTPRLPSYDASTSSLPSRVARQQLQWELLARLDDLSPSLRPAFRPRSVICLVVVQFAPSERLNIVATRSDPDLDLGCRRASPPSQDPHQRFSQPSESLVSCSHRVGHLNVSTSAWAFLDPLPKCHPELLYIGFEFALLAAPAISRQRSSRPRVALTYRDFDQHQLGRIRWRSLGRVEIVSRLAFSVPRLSSRDFQRAGVGLEFCLEHCCCPDHRPPQLPQGT